MSDAAGKAWALALVRTWWDAFALKDVERAVASYPPAGRAQLQTFLRAANERVRAADDLVESSAVNAVVLYREAAIIYMAAFVTTRSAEPLPPTLPAAEVHARFQEAGGRAGVAIDAAALEQLMAGVRAPDLLAVDRLEPAAAAAVGLATQAVVRRLGSLVDPRTVPEVRLRRWARISILGLVVAAVLGFASIKLLSPPNLALHKPVTVSASHPASTSPPQGLTDGVWTGSYGVHTAVAPNPWVQVDLGEVYRIQTVKIYNRGDGYFDGGLPMTLQLSENGNDFVNVETRTTLFHQLSPWISKPGDKPARYVRVASVAGKYVALSELEVFGRKP